MQVRCIYQALSAAAISLALTEMIDPITGLSSLYLHMGLSNGVFIRTTIDNVTGLLTDVRQRFLGVKGVQIHPVKIAGGNAVLALSNQPWLSYTFLSRNKLIPLSHEPVEFGASFCSEQCPEGIVAICGNVLKILGIDKLHSLFNQVSYPLKYTPRKMLLYPETKKFVVIESDHGTYCSTDLKQMTQSKQPLDPVTFGLPKGNAGCWASCIRYIDPQNGETLSLIELDNNEQAISLALCVFAAKPGQTCLVVGTVVDLVLSKRSFSKAYLKTFIFTKGNQLELIQEVRAINVDRTGRHSFGFVCISR